MSNGRATSGRRNPFVPVYEVRPIILAEGIEFHHTDIARRARRGYPEYTAMEWLSNELDGFEKHSETEGEYTNETQRVHYTIETIKSKDDFRQALETEGLHVIYGGHSRYGRGACFDLYFEMDEHGDQWGNGNSSTDIAVEYSVQDDGLLRVQDDGLFRLGYPFVPVPVRDVRKHQYHFAPVAVEEEPPAYSERHPHARRRLHRIQLPDDVEQYVLPEYESASGYYYGVRKGGYGHGAEMNVLLHAGWDETQTHPYDLGSTELNCKVFCHFGCSSAKHFWPIVRDARYKGWVRPSPPTDRYAYFTRRPATSHAQLYWLLSVLDYPEQNNWDPWWDSLQYAKRRANRLLRTEGWRYQIY